MKRSNDSSSSPRKTLPAKLSRALRRIEAVLRRLPSLFLRALTFFRNAAPLLRRLETSLEKSPAYLLLGEAVIIASLGSWLYSDYRYNQYEQVYLQQLQHSVGSWIGVIVGLGLAGLALELWLAKDQRTRVRAIALYGGILIAILSSFLYLDYRTNAYLQSYVAANTVQLVSALGGVAGLYAAAVLLTRAGVTKNIANKITRNDLLVLLSYTLITIAFTYPVILHMTDSVPQVSRDIWHVLWDLWWVKTSTTSLQNPFQVNIIFYPTGTNGVFHTWAFASSLPGIILQSVFGLVAALNLLFLLSYILSAVNMFALSKYVTRDSTASFISGLVFAFSPQHLIQSLAHLNIMTQQWLPLYALFLIKMIRERRLRNGLYAGLALTLVTFSDFHFLYMAAVLTVVLLAYILWRGHDLILNRRFLERLGLMIGTFVLFISPFLVAALPFLLSPAGFSQETLGTVSRNSADLATYFIPGQSALYGVFAQLFALPPGAFSFIVNVTNRYLFVGYTVLALSVFALLRARKKGWRSLAPFWAILALVAMILSLGPTLIISGKNTNFPLPYYFLYTYVFQFPGLTAFRSIRALGRFDILVMMSLSVLVAFATKDIAGYLRQRQYQTRVGQFLESAKIPSIRIDRARLFSVVIIALILFEFWSAPLPVRDASIPSYYQIIRQDPNPQNVVLEVPIFLAAQSYMYYQTYHHHVLVNGRVARNPPYTLVFPETTPFIRTLQWKWPNQNTGPIVQRINETQLAPYILGEFNIKYVVVHRTVVDENLSLAVLPFPRAESIIGNLTQTIGPPVYNGTDAAVFRFDNPLHLNLTSYLTLGRTISPFLMLLQGNWFGPGSASAASLGSTSAVGLGANLEVFSAHDTLIQMRLALQSQAIQRVLQVQSGDDPPGQYLVGPGTNVTLVTNQMAVKKGPNVINLNSLQNCSLMSPSRPFCVSFLFQSIEILDPSSATGLG